MPDRSLSVLIVEDNLALAANMFDYLEACGHTPDAAPDGKSAIRLLVENHYDVIVLDWMMPRMDGISLLRHLRSELNNPVPVMLLTAKDQLDAKLEGFESGADDYIVKPLALPELEIRLRVLTARSQQRSDARQILQIADLRFDLGAQTVTRDGVALPFSPIRRTLLEALMRHSPQVVTRTQLETLIWGDSVPDGDLLRSHMHLLRKTIDGERPAGQKLLHTVQGIGFRLCVCAHD
ncbi:Response regulator receiver:transcriptional regulatory protein [Pseudomonas syringae pv. philadelphi]|uniref:Response regulator receiver:transcriptional regulatory protein n=1 Tax=Pseudomonas syringae pv. philadelphi TaxID=251706 RepID=A0A3M3YM80_9PSED|nr:MULTISPECIES: response regulator transcription factor [Pseudomonas syringae group]RMO82735.1 Response regulator receiver:transcriptional regulatory protein [Pseudomonas syringae pv. philadelphi]SDW70692.1 DNA-binding response regulator, OmpR family, contains REC and winged-helix (wHTH) domain [Pseudomonas syringae]SFL91589.1 DNA-binding response regulator, OmpR family, contains REC and winged-helix (wHTH) domain [Pseudomonas syringae]